MEHVAGDGLAYADPLYAGSLSEFGSVHRLEHSGGFVLVRPVSSSGHMDAISAYPLFMCDLWSRLADDLDVISELVSVTVVPDPLTAGAVENLRDIFDVVQPFKTHYLVDLAADIDETVSGRHRRNARRALRDLHVEECSPTDVVDEWHGLYQWTVQRHEVAGVRAFSRMAFAIQLSMKGVRVFRARHDGVTVAMNMYLTTGEHVYAHLAGLHPDAYRLGASYALHYEAIRAFQGDYKWLNLGGAVGDSDHGGGLGAFKAGWSTETTMSHICMRICDPATYAELAAGAERVSGYLPAYRGDTR